MLVWLRSAARASALLVVVGSAGSMGVMSCARGAQSAEGSPLGVASSVASSSGATDATVAVPACEPAAEDAAPTTAARAVGADADDEVEAEADAIAEPDDGDEADPADSGVPTGNPSISTPAPGDLAITEVMLSPSGPEPDSEWFEIYNRASTARLLNGLTLEDGYGDTHVVASPVAVVVPPGGYGLFVRDEATAVQTLVPGPAIVYAYGTGQHSYEGIELDDGTDGDLSLWSGGTLLADVPYGMWDASWVGQSIELVAPQSDESDPGQWCVADAPWTSGSDDGTPGGPSDCGP
jgi:hypothetical protein